VLVVVHNLKSRSRIIAYRATADAKQSTSRELLRVHVDAQRDSTESSTRRGTLDGFADRPGRHGAIARLEQEMAPVARADPEAWGRP
jgi:hypothetical protein